MTVQASTSSPSQLKAPAEAKHHAKRPPYWLVLVGLAVGLALFVIPPPSGVNRAGWHILGLLIPIVTIWATEAMPVGIASILFLVIVVSLRYVKAEVAFKGFTGHLPWLMMGAFAIGAAMEHCGLSKRLTYFLLRHLRGFWGLTFAALAANLCMIAVPSSGARSSVLAPVLRSVLGTLDRPTRSNLSRALTYNFCVAANSFTGNMFLTGGAANLVMITLYTTLTGKTVTWGEWFVIMLGPTLICTAVALGGGWFLSRPEPELMEKLRRSGDLARDKQFDLGPMTADEWKVLGAFILAVVLWAIGGRIHLEPGFAAVIVTGLLFLPKVGMLPAKAVGQLNWNIVLLIGAVAGVAGILDATGMVRVVSHALVAPVLTPLSHLGLFGVALGCVIVGLVAHFLLPAPNNLTLAMPLLINWGIETMHYPPAVVLAFLGFLSGLGDKNAMIPYQLPPYYVFLAMEVTDVPRFTSFLMKIYPFMVIAMIISAYVAYAVILATGYGL